MSSEKLFLPILLGTPRKARESKHVARWVFSKMEARKKYLSNTFTKQSRLSEYLPDRGEALVS